MCSNGFTREHTIEKGRCGMASLHEEKATGRATSCPQRGSSGVSVAALANIPDRRWVLR